MTWPVSLQSDNFVTVTSFDDKGVAEAKELDVKDTGKAHAVRIRIRATSSENWVILSEISLTVSGRSRWWNARSHKLTFFNEQCSKQPSNSTRCLKSWLRTVELNVLCEILTCFYGNSLQPMTGDTTYDYTYTTACAVNNQNVNVPSKTYLWFVNKLIITTAKVQASCIVLPLGP